MFHAQKSNDQDWNWHPSATLEALRLRANILKMIRSFFAAHSVMEVETPLLCQTSVTDPHIQSISAPLSIHGKIENYYLQTSPEYAMKRLLAAGSGAIYQLTKAFRQDECGRFHNPEFTLLEWYRPDFDHHDLMNEMDDFLHFILKTIPAERTSYGELFESFLNINPHKTNCEELMACASQNKISLAGGITNINAGLDLLLTHCILTKLNKDRPYFIYDFPINQAALSRIKPGELPLASRFEVYIEGIELANGFHELQNALEQRQRFEENLAARHALDLPSIAIDEKFLDALSYGLPNCAGVALGVDRLVMLALAKQHIREVLSFDITRA